MKLWMRTLFQRVNERGFGGGLRRFILDALYPKRCPLCDAFVQEEIVPCRPCCISLHRLEADAQFQHLDRMWLRRSRSPFAFEGLIKDAIHSFKYSERLDLINFFGDTLASELRTLDGVDLIVPVPVATKRLVKRGFNQSALLAKYVGRVAGIAVELDALARVVEGHPQVGLERDERLRNVRGVFAVIPRWQGSIVDKKILLIDDVATTGATINECARTLIKSGAYSVDALTIARAL